MKFKHMKRRCAGCERIGIRTNKEHVFPKWLIKRTGTDKTGIRWGGISKMSALSATMPLCLKCNQAFGDELERPVSRIFDDLEADRGI
jgi:hypothetical protein